MSEQMTVCEVCKRLDGDMTLKPCRYCSICNVWICLPDIPNLPRRAAAAIDKATGIRLPFF